MDKEQSAHSDTPMSQCSTCNDTGRLHNEVQFPPYWYAIDFCTCEIWHTKFREWIEAPEQQTAFRNFQTARIESLLKKSQVWPRFRSKRISDLSDIPKLQKLCEDYVTDFKNLSLNGWWLYFWWNIWSGKTHAATAVCNELIEKHLTPILFVNMSDVSNRVRNSFDEQNNSDSDLFEEMKKVKLLVIDDIGVEKVTEWLTEQLFLVINHRYENNLPMIITSNQSLEDLWRLHKPQIASRIDEMCKSVRFTGEDRRHSRRPNFGYNDN